MAEELSVRYDPYYYVVFYATKNGAPDLFMSREKYHVKILGHLTSEWRIEATRGHSLD